VGSCSFAISPYLLSLSYFSLRSFVPILQHIFSFKSSIFFHKSNTTRNTIHLGKLFNGTSSIWVRVCALRKKKNTHFVKVAHLDALRCIYQLKFQSVLIYAWLVCLENILEVRLYNMRILWLIIVREDTFHMLLQEWMNSKLSWFVITVNWWLSLSNILIIVIIDILLIFMLKYFSKWGNTIFEHFSHCRYLFLKLSILILSLLGFTYDLLSTRFETAIWFHTLWRKF